MLQHIPQGKRAALLYNWGYIDKDDLNDVQKKSAKEIKELSVLDLQAAKIELDTDKLRKKLDPIKGMKYKQYMAGFRQATKDEDWDTATIYAEQLKSLGPQFALTKFDPVQMQDNSNKKLSAKTPKLLQIARELGLGTAKNPSLNKYWDHQTKLSNQLNFLMKDSKSKGFLDGMNTTVTTTDGETTTFGKILERSGLPSWETVQKRITEGRNTEEDKELARKLGLILLVSK